MVSAGAAVGSGTSPRNHDPLPGFRTRMIPLLLAALPAPDHSTFGRHVAAIGDVDGDGARDFVVAEPREGKLWAISTRGPRLLWARSAPGFASNVRGGADLDGDGAEDLLVAATDARVFALSSSDGRTLFEVAGPEGFGRALAFAGDLDGDGTADFLAGSAKGARLLRGRDGTALCELAAERTVLDAVPIADRDADGITDLVTVFVDGGMAWYASCERTLHAIELDETRVVAVAGLGPDRFALALTSGLRVLSTGDFETLARLETWDEAEVVNEGDVQLAAGDLDGEGALELFAGWDEHAVARGRVVAYRPGTWKRTFHQDGRPDGWHFGIALAIVGDLDEDGIADLVVGEDGECSRTPGAVNLLSGKDGRFLRTLTRADIDRMAPLRR